MRSATCRVTPATWTRCPAPARSSSCRSGGRSASSARSTSSAPGQASSPTATRPSSASSARTWPWRSRTRGCSIASAQYSATLETLAEIGQEVASILDLDELLERIATLARAVVDYRTFGILLLNERASELEMKLGVRTANSVTLPHGQARRRARRLCGAAQEAVLVPDVSNDPRYIPVVEDVPVGAGDPAAAEGSLHRRVRPREPGARRLHQARRRDPDAARQPGGGRDRERAALRGGAANEARIERELRSRSACRRRCCPRRFPSGCRASTSPRDSRRRASSAATCTTSSSPESNSLVVAVGDVSGKGVPAALYSVFAGELVRGPHVPPPLSCPSGPPGRRADVDEHDPARAAARGVLLHALLRVSSTSSGAR